MRDPHEAPRGREGEDQPEGDLDLLTIGLVVFFVALIAIVGALLLLPTIF